MAEWSVKDTVEYKLGEQAKPLMILCEKDLPRNQECILIATPKEMRNENSN
jgi:hypothetical protein